MTQTIRMYLLSVFAAAFFCSVVLNIVPKGAVRRAAVFVSGLVMTVTVLSPAVHLTDQDFAFSYSQLETEADAIRTGVEVKSRELLSAIISERSATYILDKAASMGLSIRADVETRDTGRGPFPYSVTLFSSIPAEQKAQIAAFIYDTFSIPEERQVWMNP